MSAEMQEMLGASEEDKTALSKQLAVVSDALVKIDKVSAGLAALREKHGGVVFDVATAKGIAEARAARMEIREPRYQLEHIRKEAKRPILDLGKKLDSEAARITDELLAIEEPIDQQVRGQELRIEQERAAKVEAERQRVAGIQARIDQIRELATPVPGASSLAISVSISSIEAMPIGEDFAELQQQAEGARATTLIRLRVAHTSALAAEAEARRMEQERIDLARQREEAAAERARVAEETRIATERRETEERAHQETLRQQRETAEREQQERQALIDKENERIRIKNEAAAQQERDRLAAERAEAERVETQRRAALKVEEDRIAAERRAADERQAVENARIAGERADLERQQEALRKAQEPAPVPVAALSDSVPLASIRTAPGVWRPKASVIVAAVGSHFNVDQATALRWLRSTDFGKVELQESAA